MKVTRIAVILLLGILLVSAFACCPGPEATSTPLRITQWEKSSTTVYWNSYEDYLLNWTIKITVHNYGDDIASDRASLVVNLYDSDGRYATQRNDDLGALTSGWDATNRFYFTIDETYGPDAYGEVTLYLDGKQVDQAAMHF